ncbi:MAG TPA: FKBP-type peptidyl-prolyl cis-trans isomerase [Bacteroidales bacterium]|jgi:FKBP-type peptidyl-prolyl cis-trans isomerases 1
MKRISILLISISMIFASCGKLSKPRLANEKDTVTYMIGVSMARQLKGSDIGEIKPEIIRRAFQEVFAGDSIKFTDMQMQMKFQAYFTKLRNQVSEKNFKEGQAFLEKNKKNPGVVVMPNGLQYQVIKAGNGPKPDSSDIVSVNYVGYTIDGKKFDSNPIGQPAKFRAFGQTIRGWSQAILQMNVGSKWKVFLPGELAYGMDGSRDGSIKPNSTLIFDIELLNIEKPQPEKQAPVTPVVKGKKK